MLFNDDVNEDSDDDVNDDDDDDVQAGQVQ